MKIVLAILCLAVVALAATHEDADMLFKFNSYLSRHHKVHEGAAFAKRFEIYKQNMKKIEALNVLSAGKTVYAENLFTDLSEDEFRAMYLTPMKLDDSVREGRVANNLKVPADIPTAWNWADKGAVTPVKDQGQCGSCWSFSTTGAIEGQWFLSGKPLTSLSEQNLVDCSKNCANFEGQEACNSGCNGGLPWAAYEYVIQNNGIDSEASYPYQAVDGTCHFNLNNVASKISNWTFVPNDLPTLQGALYTMGPISVALNAEWLQFYHSGVSDPWMCDPKDIDHAVLLVGYGVQSGTLSDTHYWVVKNSWGTSWGENGYFRIKQGKCGIEAYPSIPIV